MNVLETSNISWISKTQEQANDLATPNGRHDDQ